MDDTRINDYGQRRVKKRSNRFRSVITSADVECNGNTAILRKDGKSFFLKIESPVNASFTTKRVKRETENEKPIEGYTVLSVSVSDSTIQVIKVLLSGD